MGKPHILGLLVFFLAACTTVAGGGTDSKTTPLVPEGAEPPAEVQPTEPEAVMTTPERRPPVQLDDLGPAPELTNEVWLNAAGPLRLADLRGQVVLLEMWTFG